MSAGDTLLVLHANDEKKLETATDRLRDGAFEISDDPVDPYPLFYDVIMGE